MDRLAQQVDLIFKLGLLIRPIQDIIDDPDKFSTEDKVNARAQFSEDKTKYLKEVHPFTMSYGGPPYTVEHHEIGHAINDLETYINKYVLNHPDKLSENVSLTIQRAMVAIRSVPVVMTVGQFEATTPYSTYCKLVNLFESAASVLRYTDRYMDASLFRRYLSRVPVSATVTLITWPRKKRKSSEFDDLLDLSRLFAIERGPGKYQLITLEDFHDRLLQSDNDLFHPGGSIKDAADKSAYTLSKLPSEEIANIDKDVQNGTELFGPNNTTHP